MGLDALLLQVRAVSAVACMGDLCAWAASRQYFILLLFRSGGGCLLGKEAIPTNPKDHLTVQEDIFWSPLNHGSSFPVVHLNLELCSLLFQGDTDVMVDSALKSVFCVTGLNTIASRDVHHTLPANCRCINSTRALPSKSTRRFLAVECTVLPFQVSVPFCSTLSCSQSGTSMEKLFLFLLRKQIEANMFLLILLVSSYVRIKAGLYT